MWAMSGVFILQINIKADVKLDPRWRQIEDKVAKVVQIAAFNVEKDSTQRMPDWPAGETGDPRNSIFVAETNEIAGAASYRVGPTTDYAHFVEFGTVKMSARPYMIPALEQETPRMKEALSQVLKDLQ